MSEVLAQLEKKGGGKTFDELVATYPYVNHSIFAMVSYLSGGTVEFNKQNVTGEHIHYEYQSPNEVFTALTDGIYVVDGIETQCTANTVILSASWTGAHSVLWRAKDN